MPTIAAFIRLARTRSTRLPMRAVADDI